MVRLRVTRFPAISNCTYPMCPDVILLSLSSPSPACSLPSSYLTRSTLSHPTPSSSPFALLTPPHSVLHSFPRVNAAHQIFLAPHSCAPLTPAPGQSSGPGLAPSRPISHRCLPPLHIHLGTVPSQDHYVSCSFFSLPNATRLSFLDAP